MNLKKNRYFTCDQCGCMCSYTLNCYIEEKKCFSCDKMKIVVNSFNVIMLEHFDDMNIFLKSENLQNLKQNLFVVDTWRVLKFFKLVKEKEEQIFVFKIGIFLPKTMEIVLDEKFSFYVSLNKEGKVIKNE